MRRCFPTPRIESLARYGAEGPGPEGSVKQATLLLLDRKLEFFDSPVRHAFTFTPAISFAVTCDNAAEVDAALRKIVGWRTGLDGDWTRIPSPNASVG